MTRFMPHNLAGYPNSYGFVCPMVNVKDKLEIEAHYAILTAAWDWCTKQYGADDTRWTALGSYIRFKNADDAFEFKMRWC